jgi:F-type H+-transporting ATPase subunit a
MPDAIQRQLGSIAVLNLLVVCASLVLLARIATARPLQEIPGRVQNCAELALDWFVEQSRRIDPRFVSTIAPFLASLFSIILLSNLLAVLPVPILNIPPTSYYGVTLGLAVVAVLGALAISARISGVAAGVKHLFWPNPLQLVSEVSHALSLSLRLYGNIGGEFVVALLVAQAVPYAIPMLVHALGLIPAVIQPFVLTLLTANFLATALHAPRKKAATGG